MQVLITNGQKNANQLWNGSVPKMGQFWQSVALHLARLLHHNQSSLHTQMPQHLNKRIPSLVGSIHILYRKPRLFSLHYSDSIWYANNYWLFYNSIIVFKISSEKGKGTGEVIKSLNPNLSPQHDFDSQTTPTGIKLKKQWNHRHCP